MPSLAEAFILVGDLVPTPEANGSAEFLRIKMKLSTTPVWSVSKEENVYVSTLIESHTCTVLLLVFFGLTDLRNLRQV